MKRNHRDQIEGSETKPVDLEKIRRVVLFWLTRRDYTQQEIHQKLSHKGYDASGIETIIADLARNGLINEQRFTENFIYWRRNRGYGPVRITMELQARGITAEMIAEHLDITDNAWFAEARKIWQKHFKGKQPGDYAARAKQMRFLQYRGYTRAQIDSVLEQ